MRNIDLYTKEYLAEMDFEKYQVKYRRRKILELVNKINHQHVLEIGCGMEPMFCYVDVNSYVKWVTVEPSDIFCKNAIELSPTTDKINVINDFFALENNSVKYCMEFGGEFDLILCTALLHEVEKPDSLLRAVREASSFGTKILFNVPNAKSFHRLLAVAGGLIKDEHALTQRNQVLQQHSVFDMDSLRRMLQKSGFVVEQMGSFFIKPFTHKQMAACLAHQIIDEKILDALYQMSDIFPEAGSEIYAVCSVDV